MLINMTRVKVDLLKLRTADDDGAMRQKVVRNEKAVT